MSATDIFNSTITNFWWLAKFMIIDVRSWINDVILNCKQGQSHQWLRHCNPRHISPYFCTVLFSITFKACTELNHILQIFQYVIILTLQQFQVKHTATVNYKNAATCRILLVYTIKRNTLQSSDEESQTHNYTNSLPSCRYRAGLMPLQTRSDKMKPDVLQIPTQSIYTLTLINQELWGAHTILVCPYTLFC